MSLRLASPTGIPFRTCAAEPGRYSHSGSDRDAFSPNPHSVCKDHPFRRDGNPSGEDKSRPKISSRRVLGITVFVYLAFGYHRVNNEGVLPWLTSGHSGVE
jgi:hypothetical protein